MRSQRRSTVGWILAPLVLLACCGAATAATGQGAGCERFCMKVTPREGPEGSVFRFTGRDWKPNRRVWATFGVYCRPGEVCIDIAYIVRMRTDDEGRFTFRLRAGAERANDEERGIHAGGRPTFSQHVGKRTVRRKPRFTVTR